MTRWRTDHTTTVILRSRGRLLVRALLLIVAAALFAQALLARDATAPDCGVKDIAGPNIRLSDYRSQAVAAILSTSWCGKCEGLRTFRFPAKASHQSR